MAPRRSDGGWEYFAPSTPLRVEGGIATSKKRGQMAEAWWSQRFVDVLESYGLGGRMQRGRRYARQGQVLSLDVAPGELRAKVQGSRRTPYTVSVKAASPTSRQWKAIEDAFRARVGFVARLLAGEVPPELEDAFADAGVKLLPARWSDLRADCSCPDWGDPCKHVAAVLYVFADLLDVDPWLLLQWRGRTRDEILAAVGAAAAGAAAAEDHGLPVWWPVTPGRAAPIVGRVELPPAEPPDPPARALGRLEAFELDVGAGSAPAPLAGLLAPLYAQVTSADDLPPEER
jgi:uncharacterized Zn finger protein